MIMTNWWLRGHCRARGLSIALLMFLCSIWQENSCQAAAVLDEIRVVSLRVLQEQLKTCHPEGECPDDLYMFAGIKRITGFVINSADQDLLLMGETDPGLPPLHLDDFVVALRYAWLRYASRRGNTYRYSYPGCSIDPDSRVVGRLMAMGEHIAEGTATPQQIKRLLREWKNVCQEPQSVRVLGVPFDTRFAHVMVTADYDMKSIADGTDSLAIPGLTSHLDMHFQKARKAVVSGIPLSLAFSFNRFWFSGDTNYYCRDQDIAILVSCPVRLLTEAEYGGAAGRDDLAEQFAENFTLLYSEVEARRSIYAELEGLYRLVSVANALKTISNNTDLERYLDFLLNTYEIGATNVSRMLPGRDALREFEHVQSTYTSTQTTQFWIPSCGGVEIPDELKFVEHDLTDLRWAVISQLRSTDRLFADVRHEALIDMAWWAELMKIRRTNRNCRVVIFRYTPAGIQVIDEHQESDLNTFVQRLSDLPADERPAYIDVVVDGFPSEAKERAAILSCERKLATEGIISHTQEVATTNELAKVQLLYAPGAEVTDNEIISSKGAGPLPWVARIHVSQVHHGKLVRYIVDVKAKTKEIIDVVSKRIRGYFSTPEYKATSLNDLIYDVRIKLKRKLRWDDTKLNEQLRFEIGNPETTMYEKTASVTVG